MNESKRLEKLKRNFESVLHESLDKDAFLKSEIEGYTSILDQSKFKLPVLSDEDEPLSNFSIPYSSMTICLVRQFYRHFILEGKDISELEKDDWDSWMREIYDFAEDSISDQFDPKYYYDLTRDLHEYLKWLQRKLNNSTNQSFGNETIIDSLFLSLIFRKYGHYFKNETLDTWLTRFSKDHIEITPINVESEAKEGTGRLKLLAILASMQRTTGNVRNFAAFVKNNFGILGFESAKTRSKDKAEFKEIVKDCDKIIKIMT
jgi:hypothetical protein